MAASEIIGKNDKLVPTFYIVKILMEIIDLIMKLIFLSYFLIPFVRSGTLKNVFKQSISSLIWT